MRTPKPLPSQEFLKECFNYDPETGRLIWRKRPLHHFKSQKACAIANGKCAGLEVGAIFTTNAGKSYLQTKINGVWYIVHRLIFKLLYNEEPPEVDHLNGNGLDNRKLNLQASDKNDNKHNQRRLRTNTSGITGVRFEESKNRWESVIWFDNKRINLYYGKDLFEACCLRKSAELELNFKADHGSIRPL